MPIAWESFKAGIVTCNFIIFFFANLLHSMVKVHFQRRGVTIIISSKIGEIIIFRGSFRVPQVLVRIRPTSKAIGYMYIARHIRYNNIDFFFTIKILMQCMSVSHVLAVSVYFVGDTEANNAANTYLKYSYNVYWNKNVKSTQTCTFRVSQARNIPKIRRRPLMQYMAPVKYVLYTEVHITMS